MERAGKGGRGGGDRDDMRTLDDRSVLTGDEGGSGDEERAALVNVEANLPKRGFLTGMKSSWSVGSLVRASRRRF